MPAKSTGNSRHCLFFSTLAVLSLFVTSASLEAAPTSADFEPAPCGIRGVEPRWEKENGVDCGWVTVPANRELPDNGSLRLWVVRVAARVRESKRPPIIRAWGGPQAVNFSPDFLAAPRTRRFNRNHDLLFFDYRGLGRSEPRISCKVDPVVGATVALRLESKLKQYSQCRAQLAKAGQNLTAISSHENARDVEAVVKALGYQTYYIRAESYGSVPAFDLIRSRPAGLRAAVVGLPLPPNSAVQDGIHTFGESLARMQQECNRDAACAARFPDMAGSLGKAMDRLDRETLMAGERRLLPSDLFTSLFDLAFQEETLPLVPLAIETAATGDAALVSRWLNAIKGFDFFLPEVDDATALTQAIIGCVDFASDNKPTAPYYEAAARRYPHLSKVVYPVDAFDRLCKTWGGLAPPNARAPAVSDIPILLLYMRLDPAILPSDVTLASQTLSSSTVIEHPGGTHMTLLRDPCLVEVEGDFFDAPQAPVDESCLAGLQPVSFAQDGFAEYVESLAK